MPKLLRHHRDSYLRRLGDEPLFRGVPRHLLPVLGQHVDEVQLAAGETTACALRSHVLFVVDGEGVLRDGDDRPVAVLRAGAVPTDGTAITAISDLRAFVISRRELDTIATIAPEVAASLQAVQEPLAHLGEAVAEVDRERGAQQLEVPRDRGQVLLGRGGLGLQPLGDIDFAAARRTGAVDVHGRRR
jgi:hypothetical protein